MSDNKQNNLSVNIGIDNIIDKLWNSYEMESPNSSSFSKIDLIDKNQILSGIYNLLYCILPSRFPANSPSSKHNTITKEDISYNINSSISILKTELEKLSLKSDNIVNALINTLPKIRESIIKDIEAAYNGDPAASSYSEIILSYPSIFVMCFHRISHELYKLQVPLIPRIISEYAHSKTGIDIHPGASIDEGFFIDHGTGVVIGETSVIGKFVKIYQGVTLGARSFRTDENGKLVKGQKRHPQVGDNVVIYANATILGGETLIGSNSVIGSNVFIMESIPENSLVVSKNTSDSSKNNFLIINKL